MNPQSWDGLNFYAWRSYFALILDESGEDSPSNRRVYSDGVVRLRFLGQSERIEVENLSGPSPVYVYEAGEASIRFLGDFSPIRPHLLLQLIENLVAGGESVE